MTMSVTMLITVMGESGSLLNSGSTYTVTKAFGAALVGGKRATDTYGVLTPASSENKPYLALDTSGNVTGLVGPGGVEINPKHGRTWRLAGLGDSITSLCHSSSASTKYLQSYGYIPWALVLSNQSVKYEFEDNFGVGGDTTTMVRARLSSVLASAPDICVVHCGTNDIYGGVNYSTTIENLGAIWAALTGAGITVIAVPVLPRAKDSASGLLPLAQRYMLQRINTWIRKNAPAMPNVYLADPTKNIVDYTASGSNLGDPIGGISAAVTAYTYDGLHPANMGGFWMGKAVVDVLALLTVPPGCGFKSPVDVYDATNNPNGNVLLNGHLASNTGTISGTTTGTAATSWTLQGIAGTVAGSQTSYALPNGATVPEQTITIGASTTVKMYQQRSSLAGLSTGDTVYAEVEITVSSPVNFNSVFLQLDDGTTTTRCLNPVVNSYFPSVGWTGTLRTPEFVLGASATLTTWVQAQTQAGGSGVIALRNWVVRKAT